MAIAFRHQFFQMIWTRPLEILDPPELLSLPFSLTVSFCGNKTKKTLLKTHLALAVRHSHLARFQSELHEEAAMQKSVPL